jgi:hypothetical protein
VPRPVFDGVLTAGTYVARPFAPPNSQIAITFKVPDGWEEFGGFSLFPSATGFEAPNGIAIAFENASGLFSDPCHWDRSGRGDWPIAGDVAVGPTADDLAIALASQPMYEATTPVDVTLGGYSGKRMDLQLASGIDLSSCDTIAGSDAGAYFVWGSSEPSGNDLYAQGPGQRSHLWILDVDGFRLIVVNNDFAGTTAEDQAAALAVINSISIEP